jgi:hypothetical protein
VSDHLDHLPSDTSPLLFDSDESSLLDIVDNLLNRGVVLDAELVLGLAGVDLVFVRLNALLCAADRVLSKSRSESESESESEFESESESE